MTNLETFEYNPELETYETEWGAETGYETGYESEVFSEAESMELASEMLEITNEAELDRFLGDLISKAGRALGTVVRSPIGKAVGGWLKGAAKSALPLAGGPWVASSEDRSEPKSAAGSLRTLAAPWVSKPR
jgi:hypothetical protein